MAWFEPRQRSKVRKRGWLKNTKGSFYGSKWAFDLIDTGWLFCEVQEVPTMIITYPYTAFSTLISRRSIRQRIDDVQMEIFRSSMLNIFQ